jgi:hypothetical protein
LQITFELTHSAGIHVFPWRDSKRCLEPPLQMKRALSKSFAQPFKGDRIIKVLLDVAADLFDHIGLCIPAQQPRPAAQARSKAGLFSIFWKREKRNILAPRTPRRARWPAINASARNCKNELPIVALVAADDSLPGLILT